MKKIILIISLLIVLILALGCEPLEDPLPEESEIESTECDSYTSDYNVQRCKAMEAIDMSMCDPITKYATREDCIMIIAEMVQDENQLASCSLSENSNYEIICQALVLQDVSVCFNIDEDLNEISDLAMRDCIDLVARKMRDVDICETFSTHSSELVRACGGTDSCRGEWQETAQYHVDDCVMTVEDTIANYGY
jgi:hypothetical protein